MSRSTAPPVKTALKEIFDGVTDTSTKLWRTANPNVEYPLGENVYVGDILKGHREYATVGRGGNSQRHETYMIEVEVAVGRKGTDLEAAEDRCAEIVEQLEKAITDDITLGDLQGVTSVLVGDFEQRTHSGNDGCLCIAPLDVHVEARI